MELTKTKYKETEVGLIPEDWSMSTIKDLSQKLVVGFVGTCEPYFTKEGNGVLMIRTGNLKNGKLDLNDCRYVTHDFHLKNKKSQAFSGDILIARHGNSGSGVLVPSNTNNANTLNIVIVRLNPSSINNKFGLYAINSSGVKKQVVNATAGSTQGVINTSEIGRLNIPLPPTLTEQKAIATALSDVDALIANLDKLITKKKDLKQGAMQQLLTPPHKGGKRLAGFSGEWVETILGNVCEIRKGQLITESTRIDGPIPVIAGGKKAAYYHVNANRLGKTITISGSGANAGYVAFHNYPIFASDCSTIEESPKYSIEYIYFLLSSMQKQIYNAQTGGAQPHIHPSDLNPIEVDVPNIEEQKAIAQILSDMDLEIEQLETKKAKYQDIKQGMMQELLTGKTRLV